MNHAAEITLHPATAEDLPLLANLLELYTHDLSAIFPHVTLDATGRFGYAQLPLYFNEPPRRFPFLMYRGENLVGFVLATRGVIQTSESDVLDVAEFFVLRQFRGSGAGRAAAIQLWQLMPGRWTVRVSVRNDAALKFWSNTLAEFSAISGASVSRSDNAEWHVFSFTAPAVPPTRSAEMK